MAKKRATSQDTLASLKRSAKKAAKKRATKKKTAKKKTVERQSEEVIQDEEGGIEEAAQSVEEASETVSKEDDVIAAANAAAAAVEQSEAPKALEESDVFIACMTVINKLGEGGTPPAAADVHFYLQEEHETNHAGVNSMITRPVSNILASYAEDGYLQRRWFQHAARYTATKKGKTLLQKLLS